MIGVPSHCVCNPDVIWDEVDGVSTFVKPSRVNSSALTKPVRLSGKPAPRTLLLRRLWSNWQWLTRTRVWTGSKWNLANSFACCGNQTYYRVKVRGKARHVSPNNGKLYTLWRLPFRVSYRSHLTCRSSSRRCWRVVYRMSTVFSAKVSASLYVPKMRSSWSRRVWSFWGAKSRRSLPSAPAAGHMDLAATGKNGIVASPAAVTSRRFEFERGDVRSLYTLSPSACLCRVIKTNISQSSPARLL